MKQILVVEDDLSLSEGICLALKDDRFRLLPCPDLAQARLLLERQCVDLVLLDINLPDGNGLSLLGEIRRRDKTPVILLTARDTELDVVTGLERGADDYITKPFSLAILRARVHARLRAAAPDIQLIRQGIYQFDFGKMDFQMAGQSVTLSKTEQKLLRIFTLHPGQTLSREQLIRQVWGDGIEFVDENTLSVTVKRLRDKLKAGRIIKTVYGIGYLWAVSP